MKVCRLCLAVLPVVMAGALMGCSDTNKSPDVTDNIRKSLDQAGYKDVSISQDRDKGVVTLSGTVATESDKSQAESIAKAGAGSQVVADQIAVTPPGENEPRTVNADIDKAIGEDLDAQLVQNRLNHDVSHSEKNGVVTLKGTVNSENMRARVAKIANSVPDVKEVVNELQIKNQKASASTHD